MVEVRWCCCLQPSASPSGDAFDACPKIRLELASSDPLCLTALSTCPTVQTHKHFARLSSSQGSHVSLSPTSGDFSRLAITALALPHIPYLICMLCLPLIVPPETQGFHSPTLKVRILMVSPSLPAPPPAMGPAPRAQAGKGRTLFWLCLFQSTFGADFQTFRT